MNGVSHSGKDGCARVRFVPGPSSSGAFARRRGTPVSVIVVGSAVALMSCRDEHQHEPPRDDLEGAGGHGGAHATTGGLISGEPDAFQRFIREYAAAVCVMYRRCCIDDGRGYDGAGCTEWMYDLVRSHSEGEFRPDAALHCLAALDEARARDADRCRTVPSFDEATLRTECRAAFERATRSGMRLGGACTSASDCASPAAGEVTCFERRCLLQRAGVAGEGPCLLSSGLAENGAHELVTCSARDGLYCSLVDDVCTELGQIGDPCPHLESCEEGAVCLLNACMRLPLPGEPCLRTMPGLCAAGSACDEDRSVCGATFETGDECLIGRQCTSGICRDGACAEPEFVTRLSCTGDE